MSVDLLTRLQAVADTLRRDDMPDCSRAALEIEDICEAMSATCAWNEDLYGGWDTSCGHTFCFESDGPTENEQKFCGYCGKTLAPTAYVEPIDTEEE